MSTKPQTVKKILFWTLISLVVLVVVALLAAPTLARNYINDNGKELSGRRLVLEDLSYNFLTGKGLLLNFKMMEADDSTVFVSFDSLRINTDLYRLFAKEFRLSELRIVGLHAEVVQTAEGFNFDDLIPATDSTAEDTLADEPLPVDIALYNIGVVNSSLQYMEAATNRNLNLEDIDLAIPGFVLKAEKTDVDLNFSFADGGRLTTQTLYNQSNGSFDLHLQLDDIQLKSFEPWVKDYLYVSDFSGLYAGNFHFRGTTDSLTALRITGVQTVRNFRLQDTTGQTLVGVESFRMGMRLLDLGKSTLALDSVAIVGPRLVVVMPKSGVSNLEQIMVPQPPDTATTQEEEAMQVSLAAFDIRRGTIDYTDASAYDRFQYTLTDMFVSARDVAPGKAVRWEIRTKVPGDGSIALDWTGNPDDLSNQDIYLDMKRVRLSDFSPQSLGMYGYPITKGRMHFSSRNTIRNNHLDGNNVLFVNNPELGKEKRKTPEPEYNLPVRTGIYLMKDPKGNVELDLHVEGEVDDPKFSYRKLIFKALGNVLAKVALSPVNFLASSLGMDPDEISRLPVKYRQRHLKPNDLEVLDKIYTVYEAKPEMVVQMNLLFEAGEAAQEKALEEHLLRYFRYRKNYDTLRELNDVEYFEALDQNTRDTAFLQWTNAQLDSSKWELKLEQKALIINPQESVQPKIQRWADRLMGEVVEYLTRTKGMPPTALQVQIAPEEDRASYTDDPAFLVELSLPGDP